MPEKYCLAGTKIIRLNQYNNIISYTPEYRRSNNTNIKEKNKEIVDMWDLKQSVRCNIHGREPIANACRDSGVRFIYYIFIKQFHKFIESEFIWTIVFTL